MRPIVAALLLAVVASASGADTLDPAVAALLRAIETSGCRMERNGELHEGTAAADHLRLKLERSGHPGMNADQFIDRVASGSTVSRKPYRVLCPGRPPVDSGPWLRARLAKRGKPG